MKRLLNKILKKEEPQLSSRITSDTVAEHREKILAGGRRFKYPVQYARHKLIIDAILISVTALIVVIAIGWWQLYSVQNTSDFMYRITKVIPLPVAKIDNKFVKYSDYLMRYLRSIHYLQQKEQLNLKTNDGKSQVKFIKEKSISEAAADAYAVKLAKEMDIIVNEVEFQSFLKTMRKLSTGEVSEQTQAATLLDYFGWTQDEYHYLMRNSLLRQKVSYAMDSDAKKASEAVFSAVVIDNLIDFKSLAEKTIVTGDVKAIYGTSGMVPKTNQDGDITEAAAMLKKGEYSSALKPTTGDGYYIIRLIEFTEDQLSYEYIKIPLTKFDDSLKKVIDDKKFVKYISI